MSPATALRTHERAKKRKYLDACLERRRHFTPLVHSVDGMLGREALTALKQCARAIAPKWKQPYSQVMGFLRARMSMAMVRATHSCLRGSRVPARLVSNVLPSWADGAGLYLFH